MDTTQLFGEAASLHSAGQLDRAEPLYRSLLAQDACHVGALTNLGTLLLQRGNVADGIPLLEAALQLDPRQVDASYNLGLALQGMQRFGEALAAFDRVVALRPAHAEAHHARGIALLSLQRPGDALPAFDRALAGLRGSAELHNHRGNALVGLGRHAEALTCYERALALKPDFPEALNNRGITLYSMGRYAEALASYDSALACRPDYGDAHNNRGNALSELRRPGEALASLDRALALRPEFAEAWNNRGNALNDLQRYAEAVQNYDRALALKPDYPEAYKNRGNALRDLHRYAEAIASYGQAIRCRPDYADAWWSKSFVLLLTGDFEAGWPLYEWRWKTRELQPFARHYREPAWTGSEDLRGRTLLLYAEQGFGDVIQFVRYVPQLESLGAAVILEVQPELRTLVATVSPAVRVVTPGEARPHFDYHCAIMSLPLAFRTTLATIPGHVPYLQADQDRVARWQGQLVVARRHVGLVWSGAPRHRNDHNRSIPLASLRPMLGPGYEWHCLQKEIRPADEPLLEELAIHGHGRELQDFADTAALISAMDLVITVDTSVAHLAGALGRPVWILLPFNPDFRWLTERQDSPWYPTARLFRQHAVGDWDSVLAAVAAALARSGAVAGS